MFGLLFLAAAYPTHVELFRGAPLEGQTTRYWSVEDTYISSSKPNENFGGEFSLSGGPNNVILVRFSDLRRAVGPNRKVIKASLRLQTFGTEAPKLLEIRQVTSKWGEGPRLSLFTRRKPVLDKKGKELPIPAPSLSTTWKQRLAGKSNLDWQMAGAKGPQDSVALPNAVAASAGDTLTVSGLEKQVQDAIDQPDENEGFALIFEKSADFYSSESKEHRPTLLLDLAPAEPSKGADLSVTHISQSPEYPVAGHGQKWPGDGEAVTYTAHIKNVGDAPSTGFAARWIYLDRPGSQTEITKALQPGEETTLEWKGTFHQETDARLRTLSLEIEPRGEDTNKANDFCTVYENGLNARIRIEQSLYNRLAAEHKNGAPAPEDLVKAQFEAWNELFFAHSDFSFAPSGALQRVNLQSLQIVADGSVEQTFAALPYDADVTLKADRQMDPWQIDRALLKEMSLQIGLPDLSMMEITADKIQLKEGDHPIRRGISDRFPGLLGGDTRFDGILPSQIGLPLEPVTAELFRGVYLEDTDLYSATEVAILNANLGHKLRFEKPVIPMPKTVLVRPLNYQGQPIASAELTFYQAKDGIIPDKLPDFTLLSSAGGTMLLPSNGGQGTFGNFDGGNGVYLVRAVYKGQTDYAWLKASQLIDLAARGNTAAAVVELRFNLSSAALTPGENLASNRIVVDSEKSLPAKMVGLVDGSLTTTVGLPAKEDGWIEIDLGRDRPLGEIQLIFPEGDFWSAYDLLVYGTGEKSDGAFAWARELDWNWSVANRSELQDTHRVLAYRGMAQRARYIRIQNRGTARAAGLAEIRVIPAAFGP